MKQFSPIAVALGLFSTFCAGVCLLLGWSAPALAATQLPVGETPSAQATVLFTERLGRHEVLVRCGTQGTCKAYLGAFGRGWLPYPSPKRGREDLAAVASPNGAEFALLASQKGATNLWLVSADGLQERPVTADDAGIVAAEDASTDSMAFSPDSSRLAYIAHGDVWVEDLADGQAWTLTQSGSASSLAWTPDGSALAVEGGGMVSRVPADGGDPVVLAQAGGDGTDLFWLAPDRLAYLKGGLRSVSASGKEDTELCASTVRPNSLARVRGGVALLALAATGIPEVFVQPVASAGSTRSGKAVATQVTQGGAQAVFSAPGGDTLCFLRGSRLWRCGLDGGGAAPLSSLPVVSVSVGPLAPLAGGCR